MYRSTSQQAPTARTVPLFLQAGAIEGLQPITLKWDVLLSSWNVPLSSWNVPYASHDSSLMTQVLKYFCQYLLKRYIAMEF